MIDAYLAARREIAVLRQHLTTVLRERDAARAEAEMLRAHQEQAQIRTLEQSRGAYPRYDRTGW